MSDPVPNDEVDAVLSSIRRLVAEKPDVARPSTAAEGPPAGRFVLTDALRVSEPPARSHALVRHDRVSDPDRAEAQAEASALEHAARAPVRPAPVVLTGPTFAAPDAGLDGQPDDENVPSEMATGMSDMVRAEMTRALDEIVAAADSVEPDTIDDQPDGSHAGGSQATRPVLDEPASSPATAPAGTVPGLDEDALRRLVADIVRTELQGALGERITRNVRKLVRREIHRTLLSRDID